MIKNFFVIKQGKKSIIRHNKINNPFYFYRLGLKLCSKIYIRYDGENYIFKDPNLESYNFDPQNGSLYVTYSAVLPVSELGGSKINQVGFAADQTPLMIVNYCDVNIEKQQDQPLVISGTLYLKASGTGFAFLKGENPLVKMLLGYQPFSHSNLSMNFGNQNMPMQAYEYTQIALPKSVETVFSEQEVSFSAQFDQSFTDVVLLYGEQPVLRVMANMERVSLQKYQSATQSGFINLTITEKDIKVENITVSNTPINGYIQSRVPKELKFIKDDTLRLPVGAIIKKDPSGRFFAYIFQSQAGVLSLEDGKVSIVKFLAAKDILLCEDGSFFAVNKDGKLDFYKDGICHNLNIPMGEKCAAAYENGGYIVGSYRQGYLEMHQINESLSVTTTSINWDEEQEDVHVFALKGRVCMCSKNRNTEVFSPLGRDEQRQYWLHQICGPSWFSGAVMPYYDSGRLVLYSTLFDQTYYFYELSFTQHFIEGYGKLEGEFKIRKRLSATEISKADQVIKIFAEVDGLVNFAIAKDRFLYLFMQDGTIKSYYIFSDSIKIIHGMIDAGSTVGYKLHSVQPISGRASIKIKLN